MCSNRSCGDVTEFLTLIARFCKKTPLNTSKVPPTNRHVEYIYLEERLSPSHNELKNNGYVVKNVPSFDTALSFFCGTHCISTKYCDVSQNDHFVDFTLVSYIYFLLGSFG